MTRFRMVTDFTPRGSQPDAIQQLTAGIHANLPYQTLLGVTGSGKTFTMANLIQQVQKPTIIIAHNKTLASQLYQEMKTFFPHNRVEYFVSYYDYYQPESYIPQRDQYIEKDADINPKIEQMRLSATASLCSRQDVIVIASVSCIYSVGSPQDYRDMGLEVTIGDTLDRRDFMAQLVAMNYERNDFTLQPGSFRVKGDTIDLIPGYYDRVIRFELFGQEVERIMELDKVTGQVTDTFSYYTLYPATHFVIPHTKREQAILSIQQELAEQLPTLDEFRAHRLRQRTLYDIEMIQETGYCKSIENYSRHFEGRQPGEQPYCLLDYFPHDFLMFIDESHRTIPQIHGMYHGDYSRKKALVDYGFRLPSAFDNRPLTFQEFREYMRRVVFVSATPGDYELQVSDQVVEQIIRPTGLVDPLVLVRPTRGQIMDLMAEIARVVERGERALVTTLTKRLAEELSDYLARQGIRTRYLHADIDTLERTELLRQLRLGIFDVLVGINLLREGIDIPELGFIGILDADKEGFLRDYRSLVQIIGRAARNIHSQVVLYADIVTASMRQALDETQRRRDLQVAHNRRHGITPATISKPVPQKQVDITDVKHIPQSDLPALVIELEAEMKKEADALNFERAIFLRDQIQRIQQQMSTVSDTVQ